MAEKVQQVNVLGELPGGGATPLGYWPEVRVGLNGVIGMGRVPQDESTLVHFQDGARLLNNFGEELRGVRFEPVGGAEALTLQTWQSGESDGLCLRPLRGKLWLRSLTRGKGSLKWRAGLGNPFARLEILQDGSRLWRPGRSRRGGAGRLTITPFGEARVQVQVPAPAGPRRRPSPFSSRGLRRLLPL